MENARFETLLEQYREPVERYIHCRMPCSADADDVVQNTFLAAFRNFGTLRDPSAFRAWLLAIAKNECRMYYRRKYRTETVSLEALGETSPECAQTGNSCIGVLFVDRGSKEAIFGLDVTYDIEVAHFAVGFLDVECTHIVFITVAV